MTVFGFAVVVFMVTNIVFKITRIFESRTPLCRCRPLLIGLSELLGGILLARSGRVADDSFGNDL